MASFDIPEIQLSSLNAYIFCPRRCYYEYTLGEFEDNEHTVEGDIRHESIDKGGETLKDGIFRQRKVYLASEKLKLSGILDIVEEKNGKIYPVECKKGKLGNWENDKVQLCAQGILLEEVLKRHIPMGFLYYYGSNRRKEVLFDDELRGKTLKIIEEARETLSKEEIPPPIFNARCYGCSMHNICLPREVIKLKKISITGE
jgi:CRISPR-associated protein Cas4